MSVIPDNEDAQDILRETRVLRIMAKFPKLVRDQHEDDHLTDIVCPECGDRDAISIAAESWFEIYPDGTGEHEDVNWEQTAGCKCRQCGHHATVADFTFHKLDETLAEIVSNEGATDDATEATHHSRTIQESADPESESPRAS
jgi:DNA-directed RNA polymerase subunit RPC12/RpoP